MQTQVVNLDRIEIEQDSVGDALFEGKYFTGIAFEVHPTTMGVTGVVGYRDGKRHGALREWDSRCRPTDEEYVDLGGVHGPRRRWHRNGTLAESEHDEYAVLTLRKHWNENGTPLEE